MFSMSGASGGADLALDGRSTKKVHFKDCGEDESFDSKMAVDLAPAMLVSWRDKILGNRIEGARKDSGFTSLEDYEYLVLLKGDIIKTTVVIKLLGRNIVYVALHNRVSNLRWPSKPFQLMDIENRYFLEKFQFVEDFDKVFSQGPWIIYDQYLTAQPWTMEFNLMRPFPKIILALIRFSRLPGHFYKTKILGEVNGLVGRVVKLDFKTGNKIRVFFARMVVYVNIYKPLVSQIWINGEIQRVEYESLPTICFTCGR